MKMQVTTMLTATIALAGWAGATSAEQPGPTTHDTPPAGQCLCDTGGTMMHGQSMPMMQGMHGDMMQMNDDGAQEEEQPVEPVALDEEAQVQADRLTKAYLASQRLLTQDKLEGVSEQFARIRKAAVALAKTDVERLKERAQAVVKAASVQPESLDEAREAFQPLSQATIRLAQVARPSDEAVKTLYVAYCPMAKASWLQISKEITNPYMGQRMPGCGSIKHTIKGAEGESSDGTRMDGHGEGHGHDHAH